MSNYIVERMDHIKNVPENNFTVCIHIYDEKTKEPNLIRLNHNEKNITECTIKGPNENEVLKWVIIHFPQVHKARVVPFEHFYEQTENFAECFDIDIYSKYE